VETKSFQLRPEQAEAAKVLDRHISVTAGPGAGKTAVLVERYLHILRTHDVAIDQIVAITFTNRAANEMRGRLRKKLDQLLRATSGDERRKWLRHKRTLDGAVITTIHGFCSRLLHEFPVEANIDPQFVLLDQHQSAMLLEAAVEASLTEFINSGEEWITRLTVGMGRGLLAQSLADAHRACRDVGISLDEVAEQTSRSHATIDDYQATLSRLETEMGGLLAMPRSTPAAAARRARLELAWPALHSLLQTIPGPESLAEYCQAIEDFRQARPSATGSFAGRIKALDELIWEKPLKGRVPQICFDLFAKDYAAAFIKVLRRIAERLEEDKARLAALDFDDLQLRVLKLLSEHPEALARIAQRFKFFLVDEFQDTNRLQRDLMTKLALTHSQRANLFIVGDRKQSIYGFRGADVSVFGEMTAGLEAAGGASKPLHLNFRSQPPLIDFFNVLFEKLFQPSEACEQKDRGQLGYVEHERSRAERASQDTPPLIEMLVDVAPADKNDPRSQQSPRERDAEQLAQRIISLVRDPESENQLQSNLDRKIGREPSAQSNTPRFEFRDIALLFRAMTDVPAYEAAFRRAGIPSLTVQGKGFYDREEISDMIQLLRFLDNRTDELALAAVLRSPLCGVSDNALLALRCGPLVPGAREQGRLKKKRGVRKLFHALRHQDQIQFIADEERPVLNRAAVLLTQLLARRNRYGIAELLRFALAETEYLTIIAASFEGAQRLANVEKLVRLAESFEKSGTHLIRDFVRFVEDFEKVGGREGEGQIDESADAVRMMTIHQAKGLEFPVVIIPDLQRELRTRDSWYVLDPNRGLSLQIPDGRGFRVTGLTFQQLCDRAALRDEFESMRLLYVAATRAEDRLLLSGATKDLKSLCTKRDNWLAWIWQGLGMGEQARSGVLYLEEGAQVDLKVNSSGSPTVREGPVVSEASLASGVSGALPDGRASAPFSSLFPLLRPVEPGNTAVHRFSVTQLINYQRCPRQYYFDRVLHTPAPDHLEVWNDAEAPEPPANLTATLKGAVIHRFCETYCQGDDLQSRLRESLDHILRLRQAELADRIMEIDREAAIKDLLPLAENYLSSAVFQRIEAARKGAQTSVSDPATQPNPDNVNASGMQPIGAGPFPHHQGGLWSELSFRLRRPNGILTGTIDKLLISKQRSQKGGMPPLSSPSDIFDIEIIDFKTNRFRAKNELAASAPAAASGASASRETQPANATPVLSTKQAAIKQTPGQASFTFEPNAVAGSLPGKDVSAVASNLLQDEIEMAATDYQLQMQAYALAVRELLPAMADGDFDVTVTLHFLDPNVEVHLPDNLLQSEVCAQAIDDAMHQLSSSLAPEHFPVRPASHCRMCNFLDICAAGREFVRATRKGN
jgi:ATP-dependent helicase/nuclease subunit A